MSYKAISQEKEIERSKIKVQKPKIFLRIYYYHTKETPVTLAFLSYNLFIDAQFYNYSTSVFLLFTA